MVRCLPQEHEDPSSDPQNSDKGERVLACHPSTLEVRQEMITKQFPDTHETASSADIKSHTRESVTNISLLVCYG